MAVEVFGWNVEDGLGDMERAPQILEELKQQDPGVAVFSEAYAEAQHYSTPDRISALSQTIVTLYEMGYHTFGTLYEDDDGRNDRHGLLMAVKKNLLEPNTMERVRLGSRWAIQATVRDPEASTTFTVYGNHFNDRSREGRQVMFDALASQLPIDPATGEVSQPVVSTGDINSADRHDPYARVLRVAGLLRPFLKPFYKEPDPLRPTSKVSKIISLLYRSSDMAADTIIGQFEDIGLYDADPSHQPTMPAKRPMLCLDHTFVSKSMRVLRTFVGKRHRAADHLWQSAVVEPLAVTSSSTTTSNN